MTSTQSFAACVTAHAFCRPYPSNSWRRTRAPAFLAISIVRSALPESTTRISSHHFTAASTSASNRSASRVIRTAESGGLGKRLSVGDERRAVDMDERQLLRQLIHAAKHAFFFRPDVIMPENHAAGLHHAQRLLRVAQYVRVGVRSIDEDEVAGVQVLSLIECLAVTEQLLDLRLDGGAVVEEMGELRLAERRLDVPPVVP